MNAFHFASNLDAWQQSQAQPWNRLRYLLVEAERGATVVGVANLIHTQHVDLAGGDLPVAPGAFDLVLCHNVQRLH